MVKLYVEGGGDRAGLRSQCRSGFSDFITKAGISKRPRIVACGGRKEAFDDYCTAIGNGEAAMLLVDSEASVTHSSEQNDKAHEWQPWVHLKNRQGDGWNKPDNSDDADCHLMVQCMENWFLADRKTLKQFFGRDFKENSLPSATKSIELVTKAEACKSLVDATSDCKAHYAKGDISFKLLGKISPEDVTSASPWAKRFVDELKNRMNA